MLNPLTTLAPLVTEAEIITYALGLATEVIDAVDPDRELSEAQGAVIAVATAQKAARQWNPSKAEFGIYFRISLKRDLTEALERGNFQTYGDACLQLLDDANSQ